MIIIGDINVVVLLYFVIFVRICLFRFFDVEVIRFRVVEIGSN